MSLVASAIGLFVDVWFILAYSGADVRKFHFRGGLLRLIAFLTLSSRLPLVTLFVAALAFVTFEKEAPMPGVPESLSVFTRKMLPRILGATLAISHPPLSRDYVLGNGGKVVFVPLTPRSLIAMGLVIVSCRARPSLETKKDEKEKRRWHPPNHDAPRPSTRHATRPLASCVTLLLVHPSRDLPDARSPAPGDTPSPPWRARVHTPLLPIADRESATPRERHASQHSARARGMGAHARHSGTLGPPSSRVAPSPGFTGGPIFSWDAYMYQARQRLHPNATPPGSTLTQVVDRPEDARTHRVTASSR
ncbi:hypothetical protein EDB92DRAFT_1950178 [Lactarius akahatsu]|uniref:Uncharacterized protein n=1 Tax=Lactarius akahatsu TaxID=416441 RepID=A0AAD4LD85_9AGAM|nr:hypothetical protein EDB92DRAFT_1950178 [Lactarius akahatsu]